jgi:geranylgeranyl diphosphate synthase type II
MMAAELYGDPHADIYQVGTAIELFHNFSLVHDDIMDRAPLRRGYPTLHVKYNESTALLAGDALLIIVWQYFNNLQICYQKDVADLFTDTSLKVCEGQQLDMDFENMELSQIDYADYLRMVTMKTAVLLGASTQIGGILSGADTSDQYHLYEFGEKIGMAFQMQDDYLDVFGDPGKCGKQVGGDIKSNKKTFLLLRSHEKANPIQRTQLNRLLTAPPTEDKIAAMTQLFRDCGVDNWAENEKIRLHEEGLSHLGKIGVPTERKKALLDFTHYLLDRSY